MSRKLSTNKADGLHCLYARYLINFTSYTTMGLLAGVLSSLVLNRSFRGLRFYTLLGAGIMGGITTQQSAYEYQLTLEAYKKFNTDKNLFQDTPLESNEKKHKRSIQQSLTDLEALKQRLSQKN